jgi:hypothetical protein
MNPAQRASDPTQIGRSQRIAGERCVNRGGDPRDRNALSRLGHG